MGKPRDLGCEITGDGVVLGRKKIAILLSSSQSKWLKVIHYFIHSFIQVLSVTEDSILYVVKQFNKSSLVLRVKRLNYTRTYLSHTNLSWLFCY